MIDVKKFDLDLRKIYGYHRNDKDNGYRYDKWLKDYPILNYECVNRWIQDKIQNYKSKGKDPSKFQLTNYVRPMQRYYEWVKEHDDDGVIEEPKELLNLPIDERNVLLKTYLTELIEKGKSECSVKNAYQSRIKSFFSDRGAPISFGMKSLSSGKNKNEIIMLKNTLRLIEERLSPQYKLIMKCQAQLGLRVSDVLEELTSGEYTIEKYKDHYYIKGFITQKEKVKINYLFFPRELAVLMKSVMGIRDLTKLDLTKLFLSRYKGSDNRIAHSNYLNRLKEVGDELGLEGNIKTHSFRKWFSTQARNSDVDIEFREHLMGHKNQNLAKAYNNSLKDIEWYYKEWKKVEPNLLIDSKIVDKTDEEVIELKKKNKKLEKRIEIVIEKNLEIEEKNIEIEEENKELKERLDGIENLIKEKLISKKKELNEINKELKE